MAQATCSIQDCARPVHARGWCPTHYGRWWATGTTAAPVRVTEAERFWAKVDKRGPIQPHMATRCWEWTAARDQNGYGRFRLADHPAVLVSAHRWNYEQEVAPIPAGLSVLHHCDNPPCVRPEHLFLGTQLDNVVDMMQKERAARGESNGSSKLTEAQVREIRDRYRQGGVSERGLAAEFAVSRGTIQSILTGVTWQHLSTT